MRAPRRDAYCLAIDNKRLPTPPSINSSLPAVKADSSEARKTTARAISEGFPKRPNGTLALDRHGYRLQLVVRKPSLP
jgi:hypothetical protein